MVKFTILFITKNRTEILKSLNSCLKIKKYYTNLQIIILDGNKNNYLSNKIKCFEEKVDIKIIKQKKNGFMNACFEAIKHLDKGFFTFMYDDDILSPYFGKLVNYSCKQNRQIYGYGIIHPKKKLFKFKQPQIKSVSKKDINFLTEYFKIKSAKVLPNSPITSIFNVKIVKKWNYILKNKIKDEISEHLMIKKNIGPDLLLYLLSLEYDSKLNNTIVTQNIVAKFSSHSDSMSIQYGSSNLRFGYWVAKKIFLDAVKIKNLISRHLILIHIIKGFFISILFNLNSKKFKKYKFKNYLSIFYELSIKIF